MSLCERVHRWWCGYELLSDQEATPDAPASTSGALTPSQVRDVVKAVEEEARQERIAMLEKFYLSKVVERLRDPTQFYNSRSLTIEITVEDPPCSKDWLNSRLISDNPDWDVSIFELLDRKKGDLLIRLRERPNGVHVL